MPTDFPLRKFFFSPVAAARAARAIALAGALACALAAAGCVERTITITSSPPGALVYLNDEEIGRTPVTRDFLWYGNYDVTIRKDGYEPLKTTQNLKAPIYQIVPIDLFAELFDVTDAQHFSYTLTPAQNPDPQALLARAEQLKSQLQSTERPATRPAAHAATKPSKKSPR